MRATRLKIAALIIAMFAIIATACTGGKSEVPDEHERVDAHAMSTNTQQVVIRTRDYMFEAPDTIQAGLTTIRLINDGAELHHVWLVRLQEGKVLADLLGSLQTSHKLPIWAVEVGGPNVPNGPGAHSDATLRLEPGNY